MGDLDDEFDYVRRAFFPRWDRQGEWKAFFVDDLNGAVGRCERGEKAIKIRRGARTDRIGIVELLIHEVAHAVTPGAGHSKKWRNRMEKALEESERLGSPELASLLRDDVQVYLAPRTTAAEIYGMMHDYVIDCPEASFEAIVKEMGRDFGLSPNEFLKSFKRSREYYDGAHEEIRRRKEGQAKLARMLSERT